ncbi:hypothetical protein, partial [Pseudaeromonas pectinilytica]
HSAGRQLSPPGGLGSEYPTLDLINKANKIAKYRDIGSQTTTGLLSGPQLSESKDDVPIQPKTTPPQLDDDWDGFTSGLEPY